MHVCMYVCICVYANTYMYIYIYICMCMYMYVYVCIRMYVLSPLLVYSKLQSWTLDPTQVALVEDGTVFPDACVGTDSPGLRLRDPGRRGVKRY